MDVIGVLFNQKFETPVWTDFTSQCSILILFVSQNTFVAIVDLPEGEHQYKFYVDGQWTHDPAEVCRSKGWMCLLNPNYIWLFALPAED